MRGRTEPTAGTGSDDRPAPTVERSGSIAGQADRAYEAVPEAVRAWEARFWNIIETNPDGVIVVRGDGVICLVNTAATQLLGRSADDLVGQVFGIPIVPGETTEVDIPRGAGEVRVVETEWEGQLALLVSLRDISERKRLEEQLRKKAEELAGAERCKDEFLAMLAHELRNPLAPILNAVHVMRLRRDDTELLERMRDVIERQVRCMARLIDDLLDVSRITRGKIDLRKEPVNLAAVLHRAVETTRPMFQARDHHLSVTLPPGPIQLQADPMRLEQVLINLLNNAAKFTDANGLVALEAALEGDEVVIRVRDSGMGMEPEMVSRVFDLFTQADRSLARSQGGLGIGLTLVQSLVRLHGGSIECRSDGLGHGSEFTVRLPRLAATPAEEPGAPPEPPAAQGLAHRILVIDDNIHSAESLAMIVKLWGHDARLAHSGPEAIEIAQAFHPDVVLLDIGLPGMDGYVVARRIREIPGLENIALIAITGYGRDEDRLRSQEAGFNFHLVKPLDLDNLEKLLENPEAL